MFMLAAGVAVAASFTSCERDEYTITKDKTGIAGKYNVTQYNIPNGIDLNADGTASTNIVTESDCFNSTYLRINDDYTYKLAEYFPNGITGEIFCDSIVSSGIWRSLDGVLTTTAYSKDGVINENFTIAADGSLSKTTPEGNYPASNGSGGVTNSVGTVNMTYAR